MSCLLYFYEDLLDLLYYSVQETQEMWPLCIIQSFELSISIGSSYLVSGGFVFLSGGASKLPTSLSSPIINTHAHQWKCFRFRFMIGSDHVQSWHAVSLMVLLRGIASNETKQLFFEDKVTNKAQYIQTPLTSNYSNAKVGALQKLGTCVREVIM